MKKKISLMVVIVLVFWVVSAQAGDPKQTQACPKTMLQTDCFNCHTIPSFKLKEAPPDETLTYPIPNMKIANNKGYLFVSQVYDDDFKKFFDYLDHKGIKYGVIEIHSPGGGLFAATRIVNLMALWEAKGGVIETRVHGFALSAGFMIFIAGTKGYRFVSPYADLMWHEIISLEMFAIKLSTPSDKEEEARVLRHLQNTRNAWIATRGKLSKEEIDEKIRKKEWWISGLDALKYGFADKLISE